MGADRLRDAADSLRTHPLTVHPTIADALARWLDDVAAGWMWDDEEVEVMDPDGHILTLAESMDSHALAIANLFFGQHNLGKPSAHDHDIAARVLRETAHGMLSEQRHLRVELLPGWLAATNRLLARANTLERRADRMPRTTLAPRLRVPEPDSEQEAGT